jgi:hypothetical protein
MSDSGDTSAPIYCQNCGNDVPPVSDFCDECGVEIGTVATDGTNKRLKATGIISGALALVFLPILFGPLSMLCGYLLYDRGETQWGTWMAVGGFVAMVFGFLLAFVVFSAMGV